jgi:hypothetical protein
MGQEDVGLPVLGAELLAGPSGGLESHDAAETLGHERRVDGVPVGKGPDVVTTS